MTAQYATTVLELSGLTAKDFAKKIGVSYGTVLNWKSGKSDPSFLSQRIIRQMFRNEVRQINPTL